MCSPLLNFSQRYPVLFTYKMIKIFDLPEIKSPPLADMVGAVDANIEFDTIAAAIVQRTDEYFFEGLKGTPYL